MKIHVLGTVGESRFIWLGTHPRFEAFTFIFRDGGALENRARFPLAVLDAVRQVWSRASVRPHQRNRSVPEGFDAEDAVALSFLLLVALAGPVVAKMFED